MAHSFGVVEEKLCEAEFFLERLRTSSRFSFDARFYFSAFVSAARSVTLALQACLNGVAGFETWYEKAQGRLKTDPLAPYFVEIRNDVIHTGINPLNQVTPEHLREELSRLLNQRKHVHVLVLPHAQNDQTTVLVDAVQASTLYFTSLVNVIFECYRRFKEVVDPRWYYTQQNFEAMGKTFEDAISELGFPPEWAACAPSGTDRWRALRLQQPQCQVNDLFHRYLGQQIDDPDDLKSAQIEV